MVNKSVDILLATYNGKRFIREQIDSILTQSFSDFRLLIRDDGSVDGTIEILNEYAIKDSRIILIEDTFPPKGLGENFKRLLINSSADYILFSDQDDVWMNYKLEKLIKYADNNFQENRPCLVHSSAILTSADLGFKKIELNTSLHNEILNFSDLILKNGGAQGCAMLFNCTLKEYSLSHVSVNWYMHDQVISYMALCFGRVYFINEPLFYYRQHSNNVIGGDASGLLKRFFKYIKSKNRYLISRNSYELMHDISRASDVNDNIKELLYDVLLSNSKVKLFIVIVKYRIRLKSSLFRAVIKLFFCNRVVE